MRSATLEQPILMLKECLPLRKSTYPATDQNWQRLLKNSLSTLNVKFRESCTKRRAGEKYPSNQSGDTSECRLTDSWRPSSQIPQSNSGTEYFL